MVKKDAQFPDEADFDLAEHKPWDRMAGEPTKHYGCFRVFRDMPPLQRSIAGVSLQTGVSESRLRQVAKQWLWRERSEAWDDECHQVEDQERLEAIRQMHKLHRSAGRMAVQKGMLGLQHLIPDDMNPAQIARLLALGAKLERDTLLVSVEEMQGVDELDEDNDDPWERIAAELTPDGAEAGDE